MASEWQIINDLYKGFGNNPRNVETFDAMANMNPLMAAYRGAKTLSNVDINPIRQSLLNEAYGINNKQDNRLASNQLVNIGSGVLDVAPTLPVAKAGAKTLGKEVARQVETGTGLLGRATIDPRMYISPTDNLFHGSLGNLIGDLRPGKGTLGEGFYLTNTENQAALYPKLHAKLKGIKNPEVVVTPMQTTAKNIYELNDLPVGGVDVNKLKDLGYDGISYKNELMIFDPKNVKVNKPKTTFEVAQETAQRNATLPIAEGGLGLPANNTAMDRAKAMGFDTEKKWLHGTRNDFGEFSRTKDIGYHFGDKWQANDRAGSGTTSNVIPVYLKNNNIINTDDVYGSSSTFPIYGNLRDKGYISQDEIDNIFGTVIRADHDKALTNLLKSKNYGGIEYDNMVEGIRTDLRNNGTKNTARIVLDPTQIRSPNAAFDPFRRNEADILAGVAAAPVGLLAVDKEKKKKKNK